MSLREKHAFLEEKEREQLKADLSEAKLIAESAFGTVSDRPRAIAAALGAVFPEIRRMRREKEERR